MSSTRNNTRNNPNQKADTTGTAYPAMSKSSPSKTQYVPIARGNALEKANKTFFDAIKATDANMQVTAAQREAINADEQKSKAAIAFRPDSFDQTIGGGQVNNPLEQNPENWGRVESLGALERDEDFKSFVQQATFADGRTGDIPHQDDVVETINYADKKKKEK